MVENNQYENFFEEIKKFKETQKKQKQRGLNDYNVLTTVLKASDEVRLHSRMIGSLLNPNGKHYQETLFLEIFLKTIGWDDFDLNLEDTKVYVEYEDIDLYITDGSKHLIIENKIWANDQPCQITKYINIIVNENSKSMEMQDDTSRLSPDVLRVIYLTHQSKDYPGQHALDDKGYIYFNGGDDQLEECSKFPATKELVPEGLKVFRAKYKKISYKNEILKWLEKSRYEVQNITNLNEALKQYIDVVKMLNNTYKGKVMSLREAIKTKDDFVAAYEVYENMPEVCAQLEYEFWTELINECEKIGIYVLSKEDIKEDNIKKARKSGGESSETFISFEIATLEDDNKLVLRIGTATYNNTNRMYAIVVKMDNKNNRIDPSESEDDKKIRKVITGINGFKSISWGYGKNDHITKIRLRNKDLYKYARNTETIKEFAIPIKDLIDEIKKGLSGDPL